MILPRKRAPSPDAVSGPDETYLPFSQALSLIGVNPRGHNRPRLTRPKEHLARVASRHNGTLTRPGGTVPRMRCVALVAALLVVPSVFVLPPATRALAGFEDERRGN
jgi:hypothetical protein